MVLDEWAATWRVPLAAMADLRHRLIALDGGEQSAEAPVRSEAAVQAATRVAASRAGMRLWRNNVGAHQDMHTGRLVRYGLANDSKAVNGVIKSGDLIGIRSRIIQPSDIGSRIGQFVSFECKPSDWRYSGTEREKAQAAWATLVLSLGGEARFITHEGQV